MTAPGGSWSGLLSDETDVDALSLSMPPEDIRTSASGGKGSSKRSSNYTQEEDIQLCMSWENISTDSIVGNEQPGKAYWKRIVEHFHANRTFHFNRSVNSLEHRWDTIKKECSKFQAFYEQVERRHPSGIPYKEHLLEAQTMYTNKPPNKAFQFIHCWLKVRNCPKFQSVDKSHKRPSPSKSSTPSERGAEEQEGDGSGRSQTTDPTQTSQNKRPMGRKGAKERWKTGGDAGPYKESIEELILEKEEKKPREEEKKLKEERWRETKMIHQQKISLEKEKFMWEQEQRIMFVM
ncbi:glutathione S-transferase T3-like [Panicum miliaceum]|uniref:Glutathione S-transferase T3-like n=1 Tax=Panicum miliaceum TaxID=4540 RepID=A0A3L6SVN8_PANMI|nr:glutathione S-transferase T3-like [Panicum miliaceum]